MFLSLNLLPCHTCFTKRNLETLPMGRCRSPSPIEIPSIPEFNFRWTRFNLAIVRIFDITVFVVIYKGIVHKFILLLCYAIASLSKNSVMTDISTSTECNIGFFQARHPMA
ncbi:hypothetical protein PIB30_005832 [Stylosanthes scabra]|uniref:Uncharacterized protein n=1 Tax=Stylosanthes scabra TaxID=79078 RepID=A0ABU6Y2I4_9FABA|nr:hypothetical protein [Stylosanthes scabra]